MMTKLLIHFHLYYTDQLDYFLEKLSNIQGCDYDLYVTMTEKNADAEQKIFRLFPNARILIVPNKGYDVGPFVDVLNRVNLSDYDYVLKVHTKNTTKSERLKINGNTISRKYWLYFLVESLIGSKKNFAHNLQHLSNQNIGMLACNKLITDKTGDYPMVERSARQILDNMGVNNTGKLNFVAGTMFLAKASLFRPLKKYTIESFENSETSQTGNSLAHAFERIFGNMVTGNRYFIQPVSPPLFLRVKNTLNNIADFFFFIKRKQNHKIIKICKIQIYKA